jgi:hypothetical protein
MAALRRWLNPAFAVGFLLTAIAYAQALASPVPLPPRLDPTSLRLAGWPALAQAAAASNPAFLTGDDYAITAILAFYAPPAIPVVGFDPRWGYFSAPEAHLKGQPGLMLTRRAKNCLNLVARIPRRDGDKIVDTYLLCRVTAPNSGVILPRP